MWSSDDWTNYIGSDMRDEHSSHDAITFNSKHLKNEHYIYVCPRGCSNGKRVEISHHSFTTRRYHKSGSNLTPIVNLGSKRSWSVVTLKPTSFILRDRKGIFVFSVTSKCQKTKKPRGLT